LIAVNIIVVPIFNVDGHERKSLSIWYDVEEHDISTAVREKRDETGVRVVYSPVPRST